MFEYGCTTLVAQITITNSSITVGTYQIFNLQMEPSTLKHFCSDVAYQHHGGDGGFYLKLFRIESTEQ